MSDSGDSCYIGDNCVNAMKVVYNDIIPLKDYKAINLFGVLFVRHGTELTREDVNHEEIHTAQYKETIYIGFLLLYILMFLYQLIKFRNWSKAYRAIPFEREAYKYQNDLDYLRDRKCYNWINV